MVLSFGAADVGMVAMTEILSALHPFAPMIQRHFV